MKKIIIGIIAAALMAMLAFAVSAEVSVVYELEEVDASQGIYKVVGKLTDTDGDFRGWKNDITFDYSIIKPVNKTSFAAIDIATSTTSKAPLNRFTYYSESEGDDVTASWAQVVWSVSGNTAKLIYDIYITPDDAVANDSVVFEMTVKFADGKKPSDLTEESFVVDFIQYANGKNNYYDSKDETKTGIVFTNNVIPSEEETNITVPALMGDIIYYQDGEVAGADEDGDYSVPATAGYVVINTGKTAQKTYYIDGKTATLVHENGVLGSDDISLRDRRLTSDGFDKNGMRFNLAHNPAGRTVENHAIVEVGFIMTAETTKVLTACGEDYVLDINMANKNIGTEEKPVYAAKKGAAYKADGSVNHNFNTENDSLWQIAGVFYGIPITSEGVNTTIVSRPYYVTSDGTYVYGELVKATLYDVAKAIYEDKDNFDAASESMKSYIEEVIAAADGYDGIILDEIIIDLDGLYD